VFRRGLVWLPFACAPVLAACSLLLGEGVTETSTSAPGTDASPTDGAQDGSPITPGSDAAPDAGSDADAANTGCPAATVSFCDDFERSDSSNVKGAWQTIDLNASGTLAFKTEPTGNRLLATAVSAKGGQAQLSNVYTHQPTKFHLELSLTVSALASTGAVYVTGIAMPNSSTPPSLVYLYAQDNGLFLAQQVANGVNYWNQALPITVGTHHRIAIDLTFNGKLLVKIDGNTKIDQNAETFLVPKPANLYLGASSIDGEGDDGAFLVDDFVFTMD
jgi:hypothetical protein